MNKIVRLCIGGVSLFCSLILPVRAEYLARAQWGHQGEMVYYLFDWGDGYVTPTARGFSDYQATQAYKWEKAGDYPVKWKGMSLSGGTSGWQSLATVNVDQVTSRGSVVPIARYVDFKGRSIDGEKKWDWIGPVLEGPYGSQSFGGVTARHYAIDAIEIAPHSKQGYPKHFTVEYTTDGGRHWHLIPKCQYDQFPRELAGKLRIPLHGVVLNGIRILGQRLDRVNEDGFALAIGGIRLYGNREYRFHSDGPAEQMADLNNLWLRYGSAKLEVHQRFNPWWPTDRPDSGGLVGIGSAEWSEWNIMKNVWWDSPYLETARSYLVQNPLGKDGYIWPSPGSEKHLNHSRHYVTNAVLATGIAHYVLFTGDRGFLEFRDERSGVNMLEKARRAMSYLSDEFGTADGLIVITDPENDGTSDGLPNNYWDFWRFGYKSAYMNALYVHALRRMEALEMFTGNLALGSRYRDLADQVIEAFRRDFWDEDMGRFVGAIDVNGKVHDYGFTFLNALILAYEIADDDQAKSIISWLDGERIVKTDTSTGVDIYHYGLAPRSNTVEAARGSPGWFESWGGALDVNPGGTAEYGKQIQNGGAIFYVSYYDLMGRLRYAGIENAYARLSGILKEAAVDQLFRDPTNFQGHSDIVGVTREFPESGLPALFFIDGLLGIKAVADGLIIEPQLPMAWSRAGVRSLKFRGEILNVLAVRGLEEPLVRREDGIVYLEVPEGGSFVFKEGSIVKL